MIYIYIYVYIYYIYIYIIYTHIELPYRLTNDSGVSHGGVAIFFFSRLL